MRALRSSTLVPRGLSVESAALEDGEAVIVVRAASRASVCPGCGASSDRVHSRYRRRLADLPIAGHPVRLVVMARRFYCAAVLCGRRIFAERFDSGLSRAMGAANVRLDHIVHHLGLRWAVAPRRTLQGD